MFTFLDDVSIEVLIQDPFVCRIQCCLLLPFSEYCNPGAVKHLGWWVMHKVLISRYAVPNENARSCLVIQLLFILFLSRHKSQASEHSGLLEK